MRDVLVGYTLLSVASHLVMWVFLASAPIFDEESLVAS